MLKGEILKNFEKVIRANAVVDFEVTSISANVAQLAHSTTDCRFAVELSDARVQIKIHTSNLTFFEQSDVNILSDLSKDKDADVVLYKDQKTVTDFAGADQLFIYSKIFDISQLTQLSTAVDELLSTFLMALLASKVSNSPLEYTEGGEYFKNSKKLERSRAAREQAIKTHGLNCLVCNFNFEQHYGSLGKGFIHIHHLMPISDAGYGLIDPINDLVPVCPNCHSMLHKENPPLTINQLKKIMKQSG